jgi:hypothetical protein
MDFLINHDMSSTGGTLHSVVSATYTKHQELSTGLGGTGNRAGTRNGPTDWVMRALSTWEARNWALTAIVTYGNGYTDTTLGTAVADIGSHTTLDMQFSHDLDRLWDGLRLTLGGMNVLNQDFPFVDSSYGFEGSRVDFHKRRFYLELRAQF